jgi:hypothetical protein
MQQPCGGIARRSGAARALAHEREQRPQQRYANAFGQAYADHQDEAADLLASGDRAGEQADKTREQTDRMAAGKNHQRERSYRSEKKGTTGAPLSAHVSFR